MRKGPLRLLKVTGHAVTIVEAPAGGGEGEEYDVWDPDERWPAELTWLADDHFVIAIGPYRLELLAEGQDRFTYAGTETGPYGEHDFTVVGLSTGQDLDSFLGHRYAMLGRGTWTPVSRNPMRPPYVTYHEPRLVGAALFSVPPEVANPKAGRNHDVVSVHGVRGGRSDTIKITGVPSSTEPLRFDIDEVQSFRGGYEWSDGDTLQPDLRLPGFRSQQRIVVRCLDRLERPPTDSGVWMVNRPPAE